MAYVGRPDEDLAQLATLVVASNPDPEYAAENLIHWNPAKPAKLLDPSGWWRLEFASAIAPKWVSPVYHYLDAGLDVRIEGNTTTDFSSPAFTQAFTIPAKRFDGPANQRWTVSPSLVISGSPSYQFWRLNIAGTNSQPVHVGRLMLMSTLRRWTLFHDDDIPEGDDQGEINQPTELGVETVLALGGPRRDLQTILLGSDLGAGSVPVQQASEFRALHESCNGRVSPFLIAPFETNDAWLVRPDGPIQRRAHRRGGYQRFDFNFKEVSRGLPWP